MADDTAFKPPLGVDTEQREADSAQELTADMALSPVEGVSRLFVGGLWALRRSDALSKRNVTHVLSLVPFEPAQLKNFRGEPWEEYGRKLKQLTIDIHDVDDEDLLIELPRAVRFIHEGIAGAEDATEEGSDSGTVFVHCAAGKSRSAAVIVAYLLWRDPARFDPSPSKSRRETSSQAVSSALELLRQTRPMAEPNDGFMSQLALWWEMDCPEDVESHPIYQRWAYKREVMENTAVGQAPPRLRFEDEEQPLAGTKGGTNLHLRCKKCRRTLASSPFIVEHNPSSSQVTPCPHIFIEPLSWMREELEKGLLNGRFLCPNTKCAAGVGRYDWKGFKCSCGDWVTPALSLQRGRVDEVKVEDKATEQRKGGGMGIRMPPGMRGQGGNL